MALGVVRQDRREKLGAREHARQGGEGPRERATSPDSLRRPPLFGGARPTLPLSPVGGAHEYR